ncbi:MAG: VOC family protein [Pseudomonadota bacterium]
MDITNINHVGMAVRDIAKTTARYEAMGFLLTPFSPHSGALKPGEPVQPFGAGNRCVMFKQNYLEILASEDPTKPAQRITNFLKRHQGAQIICFDCDDCDAVDRRVRAEGVETSGVIPLQRDIDTPEGIRTAKFQRSQFAPRNSPEGLIQTATHLTPEYIYQPRYIAHPNGCFTLSEVILVTDKLSEFSQKYRAYLGAAPSCEQDTVQFRLPLGTTLTLVEAPEATTMLPGTLFPPVPGITAVAFRTKSLPALRERLLGNEFTVIELGNRIMVPAEEACGLALIFES